MNRVRFGPSPTGYLHIGGLRTALFNYLFARATGGEFLLRIEDTDRARLVPDAEAAILAVLTWSGLNFDGKPVRQSERLPLYKEAASGLVASGLAYKDEGSEAIRFAMSSEGATSFEDLVRGQISFKNSLQEDFVIMKSDGFPTYNFANVIDDHAMGITHVLRGEEFISSTPKHLALYRALGFAPPQFAHLPVILGADKKKLSKRTGDTAATEYRDAGYPKEALLNFLALLGWHPEGDQELFSLEELTRAFSIERVQASPAVFDQAKLDWISNRWMKQLDADTLYAQAKAHGLADLPEPKARELLELLRERLVRFDQVPMLGYFLLADPFKSDLKTLATKVDNKRAAEYISYAIDAWPKLAADFTTEGFESWSRQTLIEGKKLTSADFFAVLRFTLLGQSVHPPLFDCMQLIGESECLNRLKGALRKLESKK